jgi:hypothetical protein
MYTTLNRSLLEIRYYVLNLLRLELAPGGWFSLGPQVGLKPIKHRSLVFIEAKLSKHLAYSNLNLT